MFPRQAVGSVVGFGGMAGAVGGMLIAKLTGYILETTGSYVPVFLIAASAYLVALPSSTCWCRGWSRRSWIRLRGDWSDRVIGDRAHRCSPPESDHRGLACPVETAIPGHQRPDVDCRAVASQIALWYLTPACRPEVAVDSAHTVSARCTRLAFRSASRALCRPTRLHSDARSHDIQSSRVRRVRQPLGSYSPYCYPAPFTIPAGTAGGPAVSLPTTSGSTGSIRTRLSVPYGPGRTTTRARPGCRSRRGTPRSTSTDISPAGRRFRWQPAAPERRSRRARAADLSSKAIRRSRRRCCSCAGDVKIVHVMQPLAPGETSGAPPKPEPRPTQQPYRGQQGQRGSRGGSPFLPAR